MLVSDSLMRESPAQPAQTTACFLHASAPSAEFQNVQLSVSLGEACPAARVRQAWQQVMAQYSVLRSSFFKVPTGAFLYREHEGIEALWRLMDWTKVTADEAPGRWSALLEEDAAQPFDLARPPLIRFAAIELPAGHCHLLMTYPKVLLDEDTLFRLLCAWLGALEGALPLDVEEQSRPFEESQTAANWWSKLLAEIPEPKILRVYPRRGLDWPGTPRAETSLTLDKETSEGLLKLCKELTISARDAFLAFWSFVAGRLTARDQVTLLAGCPLSGPRNLGWGLIENFLPCTVAIQNERTVSQWLREVARGEEERRYQAAISLPRVLQLSKPPRDLNEFPMAFIWLSTALNDRIHRALPRWIHADVKAVQRSIFPFTFEVRTGVQFAIRVEFDPEFFPSTEAVKLLERVARVTSAVAKDPARKVSSLTILTKAESELPQPKETGPVVERPTASVREKIASVITQQPLALAIEGPNDAALSFAELDSCARLLAGHLRDEDPSHGRRIAICLTPTPWLSVAMLGIVLAGNPCVPLDPNSSATWLASKLTACDVAIVLCDSITAPLFASLECKLIILDQKWDAITSTATGEVSPVPAPKTALLLTGTEFDDPPILRALSPQIWLEACLEAIAHWGLQPGDRIPLLATSGTAAFVEVMLSAMLAGATVVLLDNEDLCASLTNARPSHLRLTAGQWRNWIIGLRGDRAVLPESLRCVCIEEEVIAPAIHAQWQNVNDGQAKTIFFSSPAGLSGLSVCYEAGDRPGLSVCLSDIPVGAPGPGVAARLLDSGGHPLPPLYPGQITIELLDDHAERFTAPAWRDKSGIIHFIPSEDGLVERSLADISGVQDAHSVIIETGAKPTRYAWLILREGGVSVPQEVHALLGHLPRKLQPDFLYAVAEFPLTPGGTIDSAKLYRSTLDQPSQSSDTGRKPEPVNWQPLLLLHSTPNAPTLFLIHDLEGNPEKYRHLVSLLSQDWTLIGTTARGINEPAACHQTVESEAAALVEAVRMQDPDGPYHFFGYGFGAILAFEMAHQLRAAGLKVRYLALTGSRAPSLNGKGDYWMHSLSRAFSRAGKREVVAELQPASVELSHANAMREFRTRPLAGPCCVIMGTSMARDHEVAWRACAPEATINRLNCDPDQMLKEPTVKSLAGILREYAKASFN
jgi:non-ribosomal peptide synthetase component F/pimeloyl-ACP methyl ester carboxylesterase